MLMTGVMKARKRPVLPRYNPIDSGHGTRMFLPKEDGCRHVSRAPITNQFTPLFSIPSRASGKLDITHLQRYTTVHAAEM